MTFATFTYEQQLDRLTSAAHTALSQYDLQGSQLENLSYYNNAVFKVMAANGKAFSLRLHRLRHKRLEWIRSELHWLNHLRSTTSLLVPQPVSTGAGTPLGEVHVDDIADPLPCALFEWLNGQIYGTSDIEPKHVRRAGAFLAQLHQAAYEFCAPPDFVRPRLDWEGLFGETSLYNPGEGARIFTAEQMGVFGAVEEQVRDTMFSIGQSARNFGMIHSDFLTKNILVDKRNVGAIDFDDCSWGYYLYDLVPLLLQFKPDPRYTSLRDAYLEGYGRVRPLSATDIKHLEVFIVARHLASCRWQAGNLHNPIIRAHATEIIDRRTGHLRHFLETGIVEIEGEP